MTFTIDDVRESFERDVSQCLTQIATDSDVLVLALPSIDSGPAPDAFSKLEDAFHTLYGTTSLVGASSLSETAKELELLCNRGHLACVESRRQEGYARRIATLCADAAAELRAMLELELEGEGNDAHAVAEFFRARSIDSLRRELLGSEPVPSGPAQREEAREPAPEPKAFEFLEDAKAPASGYAAELASVFKEEAEAAVRELEPLLPSLVLAPSEPTLLNRIERIFHTLKGAAATIGLRDVSDLALRLQHRMERAIERDVVVDQAFIGGLVADANRLFDSAGTVGKLRLEGIEAQPSASEDSRAGREFSFDDLGADGNAELLQIFREEARESIAALRRYLETFETRPADLALVAQAERVSHTLKGAAATVGLLEVRDLVASIQCRLQDAVETETPHAPTFVAELLADLANLTTAAGLDEAPARLFIAPSGFGTPPPHVFVEARSVVGDATALIRELDTGPSSEAIRALAQLGRLFHRLKGSAWVSGLERVAAKADELQQLAEREGARPSSATLMEGVATLDGLLLEPPSKAERASGSRSRPERFSVELVAEPALVAAVQQECDELLESIDRRLFALEQSDDPRSLLDGLFRDYHTLKGAVNTAGLSPTGRQLHLVEDFLETLCARQVLPAMRDVTSFLLDTQADVRRQLRQSREGFVEVDLPRVEVGVRRLLDGLSPNLTSVSQERSQKPSGDGSLGSQQGTSQSKDRYGGEKGFIRVNTERLDALMDLAGELVVNRSRLTSRVSSLRELQQELRRASRRLVETVDSFREEHEFSTVATRGVPASAIAQNSDTMKASPWATFSDIELDRYDDVNVLARSLAEITSDVSALHGQLVEGLSGFADDSDAFSGIVGQIQGELTRARMVQLDALFARLLLPIRDAAERDGKNVRVVTRGEEVRLDKTIADALFGPMLHLVRNAVGHGIEPVNARVAKRKPEFGTIVLEAHEDAGQIVIQVRDDGMGLDLEALRRRGAALGLLAKDTPLDDPRIKQLVFAPRLSTKAVVGAVSGRGIGGDVVRRAIERLNGTIRVDTVAGGGTVFTMALPITLSITRALLVRSNDRTFAVPLHFPERILDAREEVLVDSAGVRRLRVDGGFLPLKSLSEALDASLDENGTGPILVLRMGDQRLALQVDGIVGQEEVVVKGLGELLSDHPLFSGVTIRGNGDLVLILDVPALIERELGADQASPTAARAFGAPESPEPSGTLSESKAAALLPLAAQEAILMLPKAAKTRVLFVDDSLSVRKVAERTLLSLGVDVTLAVDGADALAKLQVKEFDIVFTDLEMPRMHGYDLIRELRFLAQYEELPIIVVSSRSGQKHQDQARALGASEYLTKPFSPAVIQQVLERFCSRAVPATTVEGQPGLRP